MSTPKFASPPSTRTTRSLSQSTMNQVYQVIGLNEKEISFLFSKGFRSAVSVLAVYDNQTITRLECDEFPLGACMLLDRLGLYIKYLRETEGNFNSLAQLDADMFDLFDSKKVHVSPETRPVSPVPNPADARVAVRISDYPNFSGKSHEWTKFQEKFSAVAELQGLGHLLVENPEHEKLFKDNTSYQNDCKILYSILKNSCVSGLALPKVNAFKDSKDGYSAYQALHMHYYAKGNPQEYANSCLEKLISLSLTPNSPGGMDGYLSKFEALILELQDKDPLTEGQKKTFLLNGVKDRNYNAIKTLCHSENYDFNKTMLELRREADEIHKLDTRPPRRQAHTSRRKQGQRASVPSSQHPNDLRLPKEVWDKLSPQQRKFWANSLKEKGSKATEFVEKPLADGTIVPKRMVKVTKSQNEEKDPQPSQDSNQTQEEEENGNIWKTVTKKRLAKVMNKKGREPKKPSKPTVHVKNMNGKIAEVVLTSKGYEEKQEQKEKEEKLQAEKKIEEFRIPKKKLKKPPTLLTSEILKKMNPPEVEVTKVKPPSPKPPSPKPKELPKAELPGTGTKSGKKRKIIAIITDQFYLYDEHSHTQVLHFKIRDNISDFTRILRYDQLELTYPDIHEKVKEIVQNSKTGCNAIQSIHGNPIPDDSSEEEDSKPPAKVKIAANDKEFHHPEFLLIDSGCNTSAIGGTHWIIDEVTEREVDLIGFNENVQASTVKVGSALTAVDLPDDTTIIIKINEAALLGEDSTSLLSTCQARHYGTIINDIPKLFGGLPHIKKDGYTIPLHMHQGLMAITIRKPTQEELYACETVILTSEEPWDPHELEHEDLSLKDYLSLTSDDSTLRTLQLAWSKTHPRDIQSANEYLLYPEEETTIKTPEVTTKYGKPKNSIHSYTRLMKLLIYPRDKKMTIEHLPFQGEATTFKTKKTTKSPRLRHIPFYKLLRDVLFKRKDNSEN